MNIFRNILLIFLFVGVTACNSGTPNTNQYTGDGTLEYLNAPMLGTSGWRVTLPSFDLSAGINTNYLLTGLPVGEPYFVQLIVSEPCPISEVQEGQFSFRLQQNGNTIKDLPLTRLSDMVNTQGGGINAFWYYDRKDPHADVYEYTFSVTNVEDHLSLNIVYANSALQMEVPAYIVVTRGGFK